MIKFTCVVIDETGCEFGASVEAKNKDEAYDKFREDYPEARRIEQVESPEDRREREHQTYLRAMEDYDDGRPDHYEEEY